MASQLSLPLARLRAAGCKVHTIIGHDPITSGAHPAATSRWQYGIVLPESVEIASGTGLFERLYRWDNSWSDTYGDAVAYISERDGRIIVQAFAKPDPKAKKPSQIRAMRVQVERELATLLGRIATVISNGKV
jgi:hypothetical protein